jgi:hypothetical protein
MLGEDDVDDLLAISLKADKLWSIHNHQQHGVVASLSSTSETPAATVAAVKQSFSAKQRGGGRGKGATQSGAAWALFLSQPFGGCPQPAPVISGETV